MLNFLPKYSNRDVIFHIQSSFLIMNTCKYLNTAVAWIADLLQLQRLITLRGQAERFEAQRPQ